MLNLDITLQSARLSEIAENEIIECLGARWPSLERLDVLSLLESLCA